MTRDEFMQHAGIEIDAAFNGRKNRMMNLVEQAWAEGKKNAEIDAAKELIESALDRIQSRDIQPVQIGGVINVDLTKGGASDDVLYPTWEEWLCDYYETFATCAVHHRIPADIAVKLGIEPIREED